MSIHEASRTTLRALPTEWTVRPPVSFCGHCGQRPDEDAQPHAGSRVCPACELGLILVAAAEIAPRRSDPFLVIDRSLSVRAVSRTAERLLRIEETAVVNRNISELLVPADVEAAGLEDLVSVILDAAGEGVTRDLVVRPAGEYGVRYWIQVGSCGPPSAALLVFNDD